MDHSSGPLFGQSDGVTRVDYHLRIPSPKPSRNPKRIKLIKVVKKQKTPVKLLKEPITIPDYKNSNLFVPVNPPLPNEIHPFPIFNEALPQPAPPLELPRSNVIVPILPPFPTSDNLVPIFPPPPTTDFQISNLNVAPTPAPTNADPISNQIVPILPPPPNQFSSALTATPLPSFINSPSNAPSQNEVQFNFEISSLMENPNWNETVKLPDLPSFDGNFTPISPLLHLSLATPYMTPAFAPSWAPPQPVKYIETNRPGAKPNAHPPPPPVPRKKSKALKFLTKLLAPALKLKHHKLKLFKKKKELFKKKKKILQKEKLKFLKKGKPFLPSPTDPF